MKYSIIFCAVTGALALNTSPVAQRDAAAITTILSDVKKSIEALDSTVKSYNGDSSSLTKASNALVSTLTEKKTEVDGSSELSLNDAVQLTGPVQDLTKSGQTLSSDLKSFRPTVEKAGECALVRTQVGDVNDASQALIKAIIAKVPQAAQTIASGLVADLTKVLQESVDDFSEQNCKDSGNGGGSSTAPASSSSAAVSSSAEPTKATSTPAATTAKPTASSSATGSGSASSSSGPATTTLPVVTAGAAAMAPLGAAAIAAAALLL